MFEHACFISYRHPPETAPAYDDHFRAEFVREFRRMLEKYLTVPIRTYCDFDLREKPGVYYPRELSERLCRSVCLVAIIVHDYWESSWTVGEWRAMERLERARLGRPDLIIPVIVREDAPTLSKRIGARTSFTFDVVASRQLRNISSLRDIRQIARMIDEQVKKLSSVPIDCETFEIDLSVSPDVPVAADPDPFAA